MHEWSTETSVHKKDFLFGGVGLATLVLYLYYFVGTVNLVEVLKQTSLLYDATVFVAFLASVLFYSLFWHSLLRNLNVKAKVRKVLLFAWAGMFFDAAFHILAGAGICSKPTCCPRPQVKIQEEL